MPVIPVRYESLKAILPYMDPNIRFQISLRMPSISSLESRIPLKIENLTFSKLYTEVNKASYKVRVYRDNGGNEISSDVLRMNNDGKSYNDIDQYGVIIHPGLNNVLPGDIDLRTAVQQRVPSNTEESERILVLQLRILKMLLAERLNQEYIEDDETRNAGVGGPVNAFNETYRRHMLNQSVETIQSRMQSFRDQLSAITNRRNNQNLPYTASIQFTRRSPKGITIQRVAYKKYLYEAKKAVHTKLFGNRGSNILVKNLQIGFGIPILRFPAGTILKIENLEIALWKSLTFEGIKNEETVKQCLDTLRQRQEVQGSSEKQVQLRINASLMLNVSYEMIEQPGRLLRDDQSKWWLILKVVRGRSD
ncbi:hypothetical protein GCK72_004369 [Caenorhabditis remanei]|uniref:Uncharacterized protein n=1 Tax=Caenorhabditis remanei TaxID=31234 RepID=A0A6A5HBZ6_CAERE|nr:hypothetical protein GCK72_004369 [Caenorhabditis remanei]KAF1764421.1 hypothetical protein GCK72_004369 [Caenorhabditis remanei]